MIGSYGGRHDCPDCSKRVGICDFYCRWCGQTLRDGGYAPDDIFDRVAYWSRRLRGGPNDG